MLLLGSFAGYSIFRDSLITNHEKDTKILFYSIQSHTSDLLSKLLYEYSTQKDVLMQKHKVIVAYLKDKEDILNLNLDELAQIINEDNSDKPYNIYITNRELIVKNSTFKADLGFDLSFAKSLFEENFKNNVIGVCSPLFEKSSKSFFSFTDSYLTKKKNHLVQVSYSYPSTKKQILELQELLHTYENIKDATAYIVLDTGHINSLILKDFTSYKEPLEEMQSNIKTTNNIKEKLGKLAIYRRSFVKDHMHLQQIYLSSNSPIFDDVKIIYSIVMDESEHMKNLQNLNIFIFAVTLLGIVAIFISARVRKKEIKLSEQDKFVQSSMHEIKTPLSIITLNNELRELEFGKDEYSQEIESAIKTLKTSYEDMSFTISKDNLAYPIELLDLSEILEERVEYFKTIANSNSKPIVLKAESDCKLKISKVELTRLIDNNLSNAIKYSDIKSVIEVKLEDNLLSFHNIGKPIKDKKHIFDKYFRENIVVGGHGLGLNIVNDIAHKYLIALTLDSSIESGTTFRYKFKCHTDDIS